MPTTSPPATSEPVADVARPAATRARHRTPGRARIGGPQLPERLCLAVAVACSVVAVLLSTSGQRVPAITVAGLGLLLAVSGLVLDWRSANLARDRRGRGDLRRGSARPGR